MHHITARRAIFWKDKIIGLIGKKHGDKVYFETRWGIHTFGLREPIDVVILDNEFRVVALKTALYPNRIFLWDIRYKKVLELPEGTIKKEGISMQQKIEIQ